MMKRIEIIGNKQNAYSEFDGREILNVTISNDETLGQITRWKLTFDELWSLLELGVLPKDADAKIENKDPWKHRSCGMKCRTCMWFVLKELTKFQGRDIDDEGQIAMKNGLGRCRRHAPTMNGYPVCYEDDWCGDHKVDENKVQP